MNKQYLNTIHKIICTGHWLTDQVSQHLKPFDITEPQYNVLRLLSDCDKPSMNVQDILAGMVQRSSNVTRIVDKLISKELVERKECPNNRRKMEITLTAKGRKKLVELDSVLHDFHRPLANRINKNELHVLADLLTKIKPENNV